MFTKRKCCCETTTPSCPTNCNCDGTGVIVQYNADTVTAPPAPGFVPLTNRAVGTVTDAQGTYKFLGMAFNGLNSFTSTYTGGTAGPKKTGVAFAIQNDEGPCGPFGSNTLNYRYGFSCLGDGTVILQVFASVLDCGFDGLRYYASLPGSTTPGFSGLESIATPSCDGTNLTADFTFDSLSGGQDAPSATASVSINLADFGFHCCQYFHVIDGSGNPVVGVDVIVRLFDPNGAAVTAETDSEGRAVLSWNGTCSDKALYVNEITIDTSRDFVTGETTTIVYDGGFGAGASVSSRPVPEPSEPAPEPSEPAPTGDRDRALQAFVRKHGCCG